MDTPRTLHLLMHRRGGGTETNVRNLVEAVPEFEMHALEDDLGLPIKYHRIPATLMRLRRINPEVVFCYGITAHLMAMLAWPTGKPLVGSIRGEIDFEGRKARIRHWIKGRFAGWVSNSRMALHGEPGLVIYNGVLAPPPDEAPLFTDLQKPVLGMLARGHPVKRHDFAMDLWGRLGKPGTMIFAGELGDQLRKRAEAEGVLCPGFVEPGPLLRSLDMHLMPSDTEGMPTAILEAMIRCVPCLATPVGGIPEIIDHGKNGFCLPRSEWEAFFVNADWEEIRRMGEMGREHVLANFTFERMKEQFCEAAELAARGKSLVSGEGVIQEHTK